MVKKSLFYLLLWAIPFTVCGQNLVRNPSFEDFNSCPKELDNVERDVPYWSRPTGGTTDYFNKCSPNLGVPTNFNGSQATEYGGGYAGLYLSAPNDYREYIQGELSKPLVRGKKYEISFYISLAEKSQQAIRDIGILFTKKKMKVDIKTPLTRHQDNNKNNEYNFVEVRDWGYFDDKTSWMLVKKVFTAEGSEKYLSIGNFKDNTRSKIKTLEGGKGAAYYYLDNVTVEDYQAKYPYEEFVLNKTYILENVLFAHDVYALNNSSKKELELVYAGLKKDKKLFITIQAHTDDVGSKAYNKDLSSKRARAVAQYLISLGLPKDRIRWAGFGGEQPITDNQTTAGKQKNRRAEFIVTRGISGELSGLAQTTYEDDMD
ncbi:OmpA family protein [Aggregatimonas sangjinii]|uniref:OmpA family protein n=1 Tax=Aggregatimonas sangjinii TaxID=2583587 RepID=A0A5B7SQN2_9FLAO|nr:OmpA family protein [Aggregatimonas sangjinii]QCX00926.1 OmpA family protein [Aggregatimonas sangjinii]